MLYTDGTKIDKETSKLSKIHQPHQCLFLHDCTTTETKTDMSKRGGGTYNTDFPP